MLLVPHTVAAARHAAELNLIDPEILPDIQAEKEEDEQAPSPIEQLISSE
jgi:hypothetical protein